MVRPTGPVPPATARIAMMMLILRTLIRERNSEYYYLEYHHGKEVAAYIEDSP